MIKRIEHIGIVVKDLEQAIDKFTGLGLVCAEIKESKELHLRAGFLPIGNTSIEIICFKEPKNRDDPMISIVLEEKGAINHICFEVDDIEYSMKNFQKKGARPIPGCPRTGAHGRIAFFYPETTENVLIELCEINKNR